MSEPEDILLTEAACVPPPTPFSRTPWLRPALISLFLFLATLIVFWPVIHHDFVNLDDPEYVTANSHVQAGMSPTGVAWAFKNLEAGFWHPLTWVSIMLDCQLYGLRAGGHHLTSLLLHAANTVLLFVVFRRMTAATWRNAFVAALFAFHPLHVETVAWAADRKDVLSTFFALLALWAYVRYAQTCSVQITKLKGQNSEKVFSIQYSVFSRGRSVWYFATLAFFACAVMSKTMVVTLPLILLLLDFWPLRRFEPNTGYWKLKGLRPLFLEKIPFLLISLLAGLLTVHAERTIGALPDATQFPFYSRAANAIFSCWRYLAQMFWPADLAVFYPYPASFSIWPVAAGALLLAAFSALMFGTARTRPYLAVGWFWYLVMLVPVLGLIQVGNHAHADRYTYMPLIGIFALLTWIACDLAKNWKLPLSALSGAGLVLILLCAGFTRRQLAYWRDTETLLRHALAVTRNNFIASNNLGIDLLAHGKLVEATTQFRDSIRSKPNYPNSHGNLGQVLALQGNLGEASREFQESLRLKPNDSRIHSNLGDVFGAQGNFDEAIVHYRDAARLDPRLPGIHRTLGMALARQGKLDEALEQYTEALRLEPQDAAAEDNLGLELAKRGRLPEAINHFREAIRINPGSAGTHSNLGKALAAQNKLDEAIKEYQESLRLDPNDAVVHNNLGVALARGGKFEQAITHFNEAVRIKPDYIGAQNNLSKALAAQHKLDEAVKGYQYLLPLDGLAKPPPP